ncbi:MAG: M48 family metalloprotease, partial [Pirellulaceae bacterium]|nr:M48 family metalloprotease [Pirellulaceae bacterium]
MDFFEHQERARRGTIWLVVYFVIAVVMVILSVYFAAVGIITLIESKQNEEFQLRLWIPELFAAVTAATLLIITSGSLYKIWQISGSGEQVAVSLGGRELSSNTRDLGERVLLNVVEEMALASGTPVPPVYVMDDETGINAFAAGTTPQNAVIGVTRGAINTLSRDQLQGVIAHEFSHILN